MKARILPFAIAVWIAVMILRPGDESWSQFKPEKYGIGATLVQSDSTAPVVIRGCTPGGSAERAGLRRDDCVLALDDHSVLGWKLEDVIKYISCDAPLPLRITVGRGSTQLSVELVRERYSDMAARQGIRFESTGDSTGYLAVPLNELPAVATGAVVDLSGLRDSHCRGASPDGGGECETLLYFWASWCGPCKGLMAEIDSLAQRQLVKPGLKLVGINVDDSCEVFQSAVNSLSPPGRQYWAGGWHGRLPQLLRVYRRGIPTGALLDSQGRLLRVSTGIDSVLTLLRKDDTDE
jgi:thiol-disulfide isomerase/thioredoxin